MIIAIVLIIVSMAAATLIAAAALEMESKWDDWEGEK